MDFLKEDKNDSKNGKEDDIDNNPLIENNNQTNQLNKQESFGDITEFYQIDQDSRSSRLLDRGTVESFLLEYSKITESSDSEENCKKKNDFFFIF